MENQAMPQMKKVPSTDHHGNPYYTLLEGEEIIFELTIDQATRSGSDLSSAVNLGVIKSMIANTVNNIPIFGTIINHCIADIRQGVFAVTNMRCLVSQITVTGCSHREKQRTFWAFPRSAMNQSVAYEKTFRKVCLCCSAPEFKLGVGLTIGGRSENLSLDINASNLKTDDQALAICAKIAELGEHATK